MSDAKDSYIQWLLNGKQGMNPNRSLVPQGSAAVDMDALMEARKLPGVAPGSPVVPGKELVPMGERGLVGEAAAAAEAVSPWALMGRAAMKAAGPAMMLMDSTELGDATLPPGMRPQFHDPMKAAPMSEMHVAPPSAADQFTAPAAVSMNKAKPAVKASPKTLSALKALIEQRQLEMEGARTPQKSLEQRYLEMENARKGR